MTNTLTDRERELVEAADYLRRSGGEPTAWGRLAKALRAYDPPRRIYTMPNWASFAALSEMHGIDDISVSCRGAIIQKHVFEAIREALSTEEE